MGFKDNGGYGWPWWSMELWLCKVHENSLNHTMSSAKLCETHANVTPLCWKSASNDPFDTRCGAASGNGATSTAATRRPCHEGHRGQSGAERELSLRVKMVSNNRTKWRSSWKAMEKYGKIYKWWNFQLTMFDYRKDSLFWVVSRLVESASVAFACICLFRAACLRFETWRKVPTLRNPSYSFKRA